jgi:carboxyl-terminal processing protease
MHNTRRNRLTGLPLLISLTLAFGVWLGATLFGSGPRSDEIGNSLDKYREVIGLLEGEYVDTVNTEVLTETAIQNLLSGLDPHSSYIPGEDLELSRSSLESDFEGIGIEFLIVEDTVQVISALKGGPSDLMGILPGDRILTADGKPLHGEITLRDVFSRLRGRQGSKVTLEICRPGVSQPILFSISRARISSNSVEAAFILPPSTGYLKVSRFSENTYPECLRHLENLKKQGARSVLLDLRDNPGGYLDRATRLADEFLGENRLIVFTDGKSQKYDQRYYSTRGGLFTDEPLVVLVNEGSASASEIFAGAIQDNDRGLIVGRRTFGKGLVQVPISLHDGSELRLTISRYYTPSGRCIQKPYTGGGSSYDQDLENRFRKGELFHSDSFPRPVTGKFRTSKGRIVYGGGGVMPDVFVPLDTLATNPFLIGLMQKNIFREFARDYYRLYQKELSHFRKRADPVSLTLQPGTWSRFLEFTERKGMVWPISKQRLGTEIYLNHLLKAYIARLVWGENGYYEVLCQRDPVILTGLRCIGQARKLQLAPARKSAF